MATNIYYYYSSNIFPGFSSVFFKGYGLFLIIKGLCWCVEYLHNGECPKSPLTPIIVNMSIYLMSKKNKYTIRKFHRAFIYKGIL